MSVAGLVLAAGSGSRLGTPKALVEVGGERFVDRAVRTLAAGGCHPVVVVTGAADFEVVGASTVANPDWETGMGSSLRVGLAALSEIAGPGAVVIGLVDQPGIGPEVVARLLGAYAAGATVAVATYDGKRRNPVLLARPTWPEVAELAEGDAGARPYLAKHAAEITGVPCDDIAAADDIDTADDLARLRARTATPEG